MNRIFPFITLVLLLSLAACGTHAAPSDSGPEPASEAERAIEQAVHSVYAAYSFEGGDPPRTESILEHFTPDARLGSVSASGEIAIQSAPEFFQGWQRWVEEDGVQLLREWEIFGETEWFGDIAHRISVYALHLNTTDSIAGRGVVSMQLVRVGDRWMVQSMIWDQATEDQPIPARYQER